MTSLESLGLPLTREIMNNRATRSPSRTLKYRLDPLGLHVAAQLRQDTSWTPAHLISNPLEDP